MTRALFCWRTAREMYSFYADFFNHISRPVISNKADPNIFASTGEHFGWTPVKANTLTVNQAGEEVNLLYCLFKNREMTLKGSKWNRNFVFSVINDLMWQYCQQRTHSFGSFCVRHLLLFVSLLLLLLLRHVVCFPGHWLVIGAVWQEGTTVVVVVVLCLLWCGEVCSLVIYIKALGGMDDPALGPVCPLWWSVWRDD